MGNEGNSIAPKVPEMDVYARRLAVSNPLSEPITRSAIQALQIPAGSRGLDAGCGIGLRL